MRRGGGEKGRKGAKRQRGGERKRNAVDPHRSIRSCVWHALWCFFVLRCHSFAPLCSHRLSCGHLYSCPLFFFLLSVPITPLPPLHSLSFFHPPFALNISVPAPSHPSSHSFLPLVAFRTHPHTLTMSEISINVKASNDNKYVIVIDTSKTVKEFKDKIAESCDTPADRMRLIYSGRVLKDDDTLESYKIASNHTVHMVRGNAPAAASASSATAAATPAAAATPSTTAAAATSAVAAAGAGMI